MLPSFVTMGRVSGDNVFGFRSNSNQAVQHIEDGLKVC